MTSSKPSSTSQRYPMKHLSRKFLAYVLTSSLLLVGAVWVRDGNYTAFSVALVSIAGTYMASNHLARKQDP